MEGKFKKNGGKQILQKEKTVDLIINFELFFFWKENLKKNLSRYFESFFVWEGKF